MDIVKGKLIDQDSIKKIYATDHEDKLLWIFRDDMPSDAKTKKLKNRGKYNGEIAAALYKYLSSYHLQTIYVDSEESEMIVMHAEPFPIQIKVWNFASDDLAKRFKFDKWSELCCPIVEYSITDEKGKASLVNFDHLCALQIAENDDLQVMDRMTRKTNAVLKSFFSRRSMLLADCTLTFAKLNDKFVLFDPITMDSIRILDVEQTAKPDTKRFDFSSGDNSEQSEALHGRIV